MTTARIARNARSYTHCTQLHALHTVTRTAHSCTTSFISTSCVEMKGSSASIHSWSENVCDKLATMLSVFVVGCDSTSDSTAGDDGCNSNTCLQYHTANGQNTNPHRLRRMEHALHGLQEC
jgi:hypothetical protein